MDLAGKSQILSFVDIFKRFFNQTKLQTKYLRSVKYRIVTSLDEYKKTGLIELAITDVPGERLPPFSAEKIKNMSDVLSGMHPVDVNTIHDLCQLENEQALEKNNVELSQNNVIVKNQEGTTDSYNLNDARLLEKLHSLRLGYLVGKLQADTLIEVVNSADQRYRILKDQITSFQVEDTQTGEVFFRKPADIIFSKEYLLYSKEDIAKISYVCAQLSSLHAKVNQI